LPTEKKLALSNLISGVYARTDLDDYVSAHSLTLALESKKSVIRGGSTEVKLRSDYFHPTTSNTMPIVSVTLHLRPGRGAPIGDTGEMSLFPSGRGAPERPGALADIGDSAANIVSSKTGEVQRGLQAPSRKQLVEAQSRLLPRTTLAIILRIMFM
jgi:hypothetical protein